VVAARVASASLNFTVNRSLVFRAGRAVPLRTAAARYFSLAGLLLTASYGLLTALTDLGIPLLAAKLTTDATLFVVSFAVQRAVVFSPSPVAAGRAMTTVGAAMPARE
jgi:putative flippase GtrA